MRGLDYFISHQIDIKSNIKFSKIMKILTVVIDITVTEAYINYCFTVEFHYCEMWLICLFLKVQSSAEKLGLIFRWCELIRLTCTNLVNRIFKYIVLKNLGIWTHVFVTIIVFIHFSSRFITWFWNLVSIWIGIFYLYLKFRYVFL